MINNKKPGGTLTHLNKEHLTNWIPGCCVDPVKFGHSEIRELGETGAYYTEWSKPERKTPIQYTNADIWNLERW